MAALLAASPLVVPSFVPPLAAQSEAPSQSQRDHPLGRLAAEQMLVLPVQYLTFADSLGWSQNAPPSRAYLNTVDDEIAFALEQRGLKGRWTMVPDLVRSVARNPGYAPDPHSLAAAAIRIGAKGAGFELPEPLASQLRSLIALTDARYVLFPVELKLTGSGGYGHAILHLVVIDARRSQVDWTGDLAGAAVAKFSPAIAADLASRLGDLIASPVN